MTFDEFVLQNPFLTRERFVTLSEFRARCGYPDILDEHGGLKYPNGISKTERRRIDTRLAAHQKELIASENEYHALKEKGELPVKLETFQASRIAESVQTAAMYHSRWKRVELQRTLGVAAGSPSSLPAPPSIPQE